MVVYNPATLEDADKISSLIGLAPIPASEATVRSDANADA